jgi:trans-aconitate methyltransferase
MAEIPVGETYYENERPEVARLVPPSARTILDVGCGKGNLGALLRRGIPERTIHGIECVPVIAREAEKVLDSVLVGDLQTMSLPFLPGYFDCMVFADVLEHLVDPKAVLRKLRPLVADGGVIVCSIPNIRHYTAVMRLVIHGWSYDDFGLFDRTHVHFFSRRSMLQLLTESGFTVVSCEPRIVASWKMRALNALLLGLTKEFLAFQYLLVAKPGTSTH